MKDALAVSQIGNLALRFSSEGVGFSTSADPFMPTPRTRAKPLVGIIMGSKSDWETMRHAVERLEEFGVPLEASVVSAHRTPEWLFRYASTAADRGLEVVIAGAGGAAHLPGMTASLTSLPVLGVPVESRALRGLDSLLSIAQMPGGVPVACLAVGKAGAINAALLALAILGNKHPRLRRAYERFRAKQTRAVMADRDPRPPSARRRPKRRASTRNGRAGLRRTS